MALELNFVSARTNKRHHHQETTARERFFAPQHRDSLTGKGGLDLRTLFSSRSGELDPLVCASARSLESGSSSK